MHILFKKCNILLKIFKYLNSLNGKLVSKYWERKNKLFYLSTTLSKKSLYYESTML